MPIKRPRRRAALIVEANGAVDCEASNRTWLNCLVFVRRENRSICAAAQAQNKNDGGEAGSQSLYLHRRMLPDLDFFAKARHTDPMCCLIYTPSPLASLPFRGRGEN